ncbi:MAG: type IV pilus assembly protein PilM [Candidatus Staskawiczbacteria bacterium]|nr:type IV pilus assembly protein PilM [Candidatus Staskawiczbacteria bacterium]
MGILDIKYDAFGLDINDFSLKIVKLKKGRKGFSLVSYNDVKIAPGVVESGVIKDENSLAKIIRYACATIKGKKLKTKNVVVSLPEEKSFSQVIQIPEMNEEELKTAVPLEAENYIPLPIAEVYLDFQVIPPIKQYSKHTEVQIVAMPKRIVDSYVSCIKKAGLTAVAMETESEAIVRALVRGDNNPSVSLLIDFGGNNTNLVVYSGKSIRFSASILVSSEILTKAISKALKVDFYEAERLKLEYGLLGKKAGRSSTSSVNAEKVAQVIKPILEEMVCQIKKYLNFYRDHSSFEYFLPDGKKERVLLCGGGAELKGFADFISQKLEIPVELGNPLLNFPTKNVRVKNIIKKDLMSFTTAIGLAQRKLYDE